MTDRLQAAIAALDALNRADPNVVPTPTGPRPKELVYAERMSGWLERLAPSASEALQLAVRAQHLARWRLPRADFPMDRAGYKAWRKAAGVMHAALAAEVLAGQGYDAAFCERVSALIQKRQFKVDPEAQRLEDVACLVFLEFYFADFAAPHPAEKVIDIVRKTWVKMSEAGQAAALTLPLGPRERALVAEALGGA